MKNVKTKDDMNKKNTRINVEKKNRLKSRYNLNPYQLKLFQQLIQIIPEFKDKCVVEELLIMHILGINQDIRTVEVLKILDLKEGDTIENKRTYYQ